MNGWWKLMVGTFGAAALSGLIAWGGLRADVAQLKESRPAVEQRLQSVEKNLSKLVGLVEAQTDAAKEFREVQREQSAELNRKLNTLLEKSGER